jgi:hypothetical protein
MKERIAKAISIITVPPIIAALAVTWILLKDKSYFDNILAWYFLVLVFLTVVPISAYPLSRVIPKIRARGRDGERNLAFIMAILGYIAGTIASIVFNAPRGVMYIILSYLASGLVLLFVNKGIRIKASGHACGVSGPITLLLYMVGHYAFAAVILLPIVFWGRLSLKRHTSGELIIGTIVGIFSTGLVLLLYK